MIVTTLITNKKNGNSVKISEIPELRIRRTILF